MGGRGTGRRRQDGARGQEGGPSAQTARVRERRQRRGARWQDREGEVRGANTVRAREKSAGRGVWGSEAAKERERWGPREV